MSTFIGSLTAIVIGASLGAATVHGVVLAQAPDDAHALQSTTVPSRTLVTNDMHLEMLVGVNEWRIANGRSPIVFHCRAASCS